MKDPDPTGLAKLREPFAEHQIGKLPKPYKKDSPKAQCRECGGFHGMPALHLDYVGHAALTDRFLDVDPAWSWEPMATDDYGMPVLDRNGGLWIRLTILGVTRPGYGDAQGKTGGNAVKEAIGDALRNAGMRFGAALDLWHKGDLHEVEEEKGTPPEPWMIARDELVKAVKAAGIDAQQFAAWAISPAGPGINLRECRDVEALQGLTRRVKSDGAALVGDAA